MEKRRSYYLKDGCHITMIGNNKPSEDLIEACQKMVEIIQKLSPEQLDSFKENKQ